MTGAEAPRVRAAVDGLDHTIVCENPDWQSGIASSLRTGLDAVDSVKGVDGAVISLVDQPHISPQTLRELMQAFTPDCHLVASSYSGILGVPAILGREYFNELRGLSGDAGAGHWLRSQDNVRSVTVEGAALDIDTPGDVENLLRSSD